MMKIIHLSSGDGPSSSHRSEESGQCVQTDHKGHVGGEDHGVSNLSVNGKLD